MTVRDDPGVDLARVTAWIVANVDGVVAPFTVHFISGGRSNLTYRLVDAAGRDLVLRRPPLGHVLPSAHDMGREHRIIAALRDTDVPVADALGLCEDVSVNGAPFYLMDFVEGAVLASARRRRGVPVRVASPGRRGPDRRAWAGCTPSTPTPSVSARSGARRATSPVS